MSRFRLTPAALNDLREIDAYTMAQFGEERAIKIEGILFDTFQRLADFPGMGRIRPDLTRKPFLFLLSKPFLIAYEPTHDPVLIHSVLHGSRDIRRVLRQRVPLDA